MEDITIDKLMSELSTEELKELHNSTKVEFSRVTVPLLGVIDEGKIAERAKMTLWLHLEIERDCKVLYAKYTYAAKVTTDKKGRNRFKVDKIHLDIYPRYGEVSNYDREKKNTSRYTHVEEIVAKSACGKTKCIATATYFGSSWRTESSL